MSEPGWDELRVSNGPVWIGPPRYALPPWYKRLWRWVRGGFKRKRPFPDDPAFSSVVMLAHFDGRHDVRLGPSKSDWSEKGKP